MEDNELTFDMIGNMSDDEIQAHKEKTNTEEVTEDNDVLFPEIGTDDDNPEGVGDESQEDEEDTDKPEDNDNKGGSSPNFFASIANSLKEEGILTLDDSEFKDVNDGAKLAALMEKQVNTMLDAKQKRIDEALSNDVPVDTVKQFEQLIAYVGGITEDSIKDETPEAEQLRGNIIVQDYLNKGFSQERANREAKRAFESGSDIEVALEALTELKSYYTSEYDNVIKESKQAKEDKLKEERELSKKIEDKFLKVEEPIKGIKLTENDRKKVLNSYSKFVGNDEGGKPINAIQKYAIDNPIDYQYNINLLFYLTNGFKDMGNVIQKEVKKKTNSAMQDLERTLRNPSNNIGGGNMSFDNDRSPESFKGISVDLD